MRTFLAFGLALVLSGSAYAFVFRTSTGADGGPGMTALDHLETFDEGTTDTIGAVVFEPGTFNVPHLNTGCADLQVNWTQVSGAPVASTFDGMSAAHLTANFATPEVWPAGATFKYRYDVTDNNPAQFLNTFVILLD